MGKIIQRDKSIVVACDVSALEEFTKIVEETHNIEGVGGYKIGFELALDWSLSAVVFEARQITNKPIIYDHQKAGTDIPDTGKSFAKLCKNADVNAVILFPLSGPETQEAWTKAAQDNGLEIIIGGLMTHPKFLTSEGGYISDDRYLEIYRVAVKTGVTNFVVPGNKPDVIKTVKETVEAEGISPVFYAPGFVAQGGNISEAAKVAGNYWHAIIGRGIYEAEDIRKAALEYTKQL